MANDRRTCQEILKAKNASARLGRSTPHRTECISCNACGDYTLRAPSMGALLRVKVPPQVDHDE
jgi:hypothetical protein